MSPLPLPVRVAAGLAVTAVHQVRQFPTQLITFPITVVSRALQAGMRVQQQVTELAIKGDELFAYFQPVDETPPWATFDEDTFDGATFDANPSNRATFDADTGNGAHDRALTTVPSPPRPRVRPADPAPLARPTGGDEVSEADVARALVPGATPEPEPEPEPAAPVEVPASVGASTGGTGPPPAMPGYDEYSLAQLRARLRKLSAEQLEALLAYEQRHQDRAPFVTMLSNRITTVRSQ